MNTEMKLCRALIGAAALLLAACGGSGGPDNGMTQNTGSSMPVVTIGAISAFGSVYVNGVRYDTNGATVSIDDRPGVESELQVGDVVRIAGRLNDDRRGGTASTIDCNDAVEGPVQAVDIAAGTLVVLGQTVKVDASTSFDDDIQPPTLAGVAVGAIVEVSGFRDANGVIRATRIERHDPGAEFEVTGVVTNHDAGAKRFAIGTLLIDYGAAQLDDLPGGSLADGLLVEVKGQSLDANGVLLATRVEGERGGMNADDDDEAEIEGLITRFASATDFDVNMQPVTTTASTQFENGTSADLALNARVEVEGEILNGVLSAEKVKFELESNLRVSATIEAIDAATGSFTVLGIRIETSAATRFEDKSAAGLRPFGLSNLHVGDFVEVRGSAGSVVDSIAGTLVEREDDGGRIELRGPAADVVEPQLTILGVTVLTDSGTEFKDESDAAISAATFFAQAAGQLVAADGQLAGEALMAREIELEGNDD